MNHLTKKTIVFLLILSILAGFFPLKKAEAQWAVFDVAALAEAVWEWVKDNYQKVLRDVIAKRLIDYIVDETVQ